MMSNKSFNMGFTLVEMLVVVAIVALVAGFVLPNMGKLMGGESQAQTMNLLDAKLRVARAMAVRQRNYVGVHFQRHYQTGEMWCAIVRLSDDSRLGRDVNDSYDMSGQSVSYDDANFISRKNTWSYNDLARLRFDETYALTLLPGSPPSKLPGGWRVGPVCSELGDGYENLYDNSFRRYVAFEKPGAGATIGDITRTSITIMFDPDGKTIMPQKQSPWNFMVLQNNKLYADKLFDGEDGEKIWDIPETTDTIVNALCIYDGKEFDDLLSDQERIYYLNENAGFLVVNPCVGGLIRSATE